MKMSCKIAAWSVPGVLLAGMTCVPARAQDPLVTAPIVADVAVPIIVAAVKPKPSGLA